MKIQFSDNSQVHNSQFGHDNKMYIGESKVEYVISQKYWEELDEFLSKRLTEKLVSEEAYQMVEEALKYVKEKDETGFKGFLKRNKESFFQIY